ncbi:ParB/RepB/Spo0J family partition protein [Ruixingdingia sedimenti]|uniref:ParB/RepB/Spo0J family partition protein n=1 Tax=Ruixingdingia sedimenti TaxID=3073604 RepID=A0ABU1F878_9RHOB|nr:ParB/RepB/Spo0J family partition protein [Xinfangfangia sp. LG-4]MDR5652659.1 ParB/RepB/Spo0J family partition protein [Xinfangfangia sp. LG-4]
MNDRKPERRGLARGLSSLMADVAADRPAEAADRPRPADRNLPIEALAPNPGQPRRDFDPEGLEELAQSIREHGVIQPLIVRRQPEGEGYQIVAGERRWRAAQMAKLHEVPVVVRDYSDTEVLEVAIIENIQRADLNPVEEALGYRQLIDRFGHTQERIAEALGKSRSHVANAMRLLQLPDEVLGLLRDGALSAGHARTLIGAPEPLAMAQRIIREGLTVREAERLAQAGKAAESPGSAPRRRNPAEEKDADTRALEADLSANLGMSVKITHEPGSEAGIISIRYNRFDDLDRLCNVLSAISRDTQI